MVKVSVIVPVYNTEKYLKKCLDSLINQTLKEIEIIVINDGSNDGSQSIIDNYEKKYSNIKAFKKLNSGVGDTRNYGIKKAKGKYIAFLDSDDYVENTMYEKMYNKAINNNFDLVVCNVNLFYNNKKKLVSCYLDKDIYDEKDIKKLLIKNYPVVWNFLYKKNLFNNISFKKGVWYEDVEFLYRLFPNVNKIGVVKEYLVNYVKREGSITNTFNSRLYDYISNWNGLIDFYQKNNLYTKYSKELEYSYVRYLYCTFVKQATNFNKKEYQKAVSIAKKNVKKYFPNYRKNKYFYKSLNGIYMITFCRLSQFMIYKIYHK